MRVLAVTLALMASACSDGLAGPDAPPFQLIVNAQTTSEGYNSETERYECTYTLVATAHGGQDGEAALWEDGEVDFRRESGGVSTYYLSDDDLLDHWGSDRLRSGERAESPRVTWSNEPYLVATTIRYRLELSGERRSATVYSCD